MLLGRKNENTVEGNEGIQVKGTISENRQEIAQYTFSSSCNASAIPFFSFFEFS